MSDLPGITVAKGAALLDLLPHYANRHGLIAGATGTGKTVTLQLIAEGLSARGVPVFLADVKGDLAGLSQAGEAKPKIHKAAVKTPPPAPQGPYQVEMIRGSKRDETKFEDNK